MKNLLNKILFPNKIIGFILFNLGFGLLIYVFTCSLEDTPIAYISYGLSTYALIMFCIWFYKVCKFSNSIIKNSKLYKIYKEHSQAITKTSLYSSTAINILYCLFNLIVGIYYKSFWFITFAAYYFLLGLIKSLLLYNVKDFGTYKTKEYKKMKKTGVVLFLLNIVLTGIIILILKTNQNITYAGYVIYIVALYDFYLIINAFINVFKFRKNDSPVLLASKCINLTVAMITMLSLEVAMIAEFGGNGDENFRKMMVAYSGGVICLINSFMAVYLIVKANIYLKIKQPKIDN